MLAREFILALFLSAVSSAGDCRWYEAVEFWSNVICSMENCKTVNFHRMLGNDRRSISVSRCFDDLVHVVARRCQTTIVLKTYTFQGLMDAESFADDEETVRGSVKWSLIRRRITSDGGNVVPATQATVKRAPAQRHIQVSSYERNTWNVHVILVTDIHSFDRILRAKLFEWESRDRFIVLIVHRSKHQGENESSVVIENTLRILWYDYKVYNVFISDGIYINNTTQINQLVSTYNPFAKVNDSAWGGINVVRVNTTARSSNLTTNRCAGNLNGYELKVGIFEAKQSIASPIKNSVNITSNTRYDFYDVFKGFDEAILDVVSRKMNFTVKRVHPTDNKSFGYQLRNGTYVGAIGDVVYGRTDICFESFFVKKYSPNTNDMLIEFTTQVEFDKVCVIAPKASLIPKWLRIYHFFPLSIWIFSLLSHVLTFITWYLLQTYNPERTEKINFLTTAYRSFLFNCGCPQQLPCTNAERILLSSVFLGNITIIGFFNGMLYKSFANDMYYKDINTLEDLDASKLPIIFASLGVSDLFGSKNDTDSTPIMQSLRQKLQQGYNSLNIAAYYRNATGLIRKHHFAIMNEELIDKNGAPLLHLIEECPGTYYLSYLLPKNSILRERVNGVIGQLNQAGFPTLWTSRTIQHTVVKKKLSAKQSKHKADYFVAFSLSDLQTSFFTLLAGLLVSAMVFFHERGWLKIPSSRSGKSNSRFNH